MPVFVRGWCAQVGVSYRVTGFLCSRIEALQRVRSRRCAAVGVGSFHGVEGDRLFGFTLQVLLRVQVEVGKAVLGA